jgi:hypothetical protein
LWLQKIAAELIELRQFSHHGMLGEGLLHICFQAVSSQEEFQMSEYPSGYRSQTSSVPPPNFTLPVNPGILVPHLSQTNPAKWAHRKFIECLYNFEKSLDDDHEIGARLLSFAAEITFYIQDVGYYDPHMISFSGSNEDEEKLQLVQHVSQLNIFLVAMKKRGREPIRIGFKLKRAAEEEG